MTTRDKIVTLDILCEWSYDYGLTNGCFDILHHGHVEFLEQAKHHSFEQLAVAINDDESVRKLKGPTRPINNAKDRARVIAALECVDWVVIFKETDVVSLMRQLRPQHWFKGGDYTMNSLNQDEVKAAHDVGTRIVLLPMVENYSTTKIVQAMKTN